MVKAEDKKDVFEKTMSHIFDKQPFVTDCNGFCASSEKEKERSYGRISN